MRSLLLIVAALIGAYLAVSIVAGLILVPMLPVLPRGVLGLVIILTTVPVSLVFHRKLLARSDKDVSKGV